MQTSVEEWTQRLPHLCITAGALTMRPFCEELEEAYRSLMENCQIFDDLSAPHVFPWARQQAANPLAFATQAVAFQRSKMTALRPDIWDLPLLVSYQGRLIGSQDLRSKDFAHSHAISSGSWLDLAYHGRGIGSLMRRALLIFAFDYLGAHVAYSVAKPSNAPSAHTSFACGYQLIPASHMPELADSVIPSPDDQFFMVTPHTLIRKDVHISVSW